MPVRRNKSTRHKAVLTPVKTAYFAGLLDGEGYVTLAKNQDRVKPTWNVPSIIIAMTHQPTIVACREYFCCGSVHIKAYPNNSRFKTLYAWIVRWNDARFVAAVLRPYSITKADDLDRIINFPIQRSGPARKFDATTVRKIRAAYNGSYAKLGKQYGIVTMTAWKIVNRRTYAEVKG